MSCLPSTVARLSRWSTTDLVQQVQQSGLLASISGSTLWRWLHEDAIRPWYQRSWIFPRDREFATKAGRVLDLYAREWQGCALKDDEFVISADEESTVQARRRKHHTQNCGPHTPLRVEHEYFRCGAWTYIAALDVHHAKIFGRCEAKNGIAPLDRLVEQVMTRPPYNDARRVFRIVDNSSAHRGVKAVERLRNRYRHLTLVHAPIHASWLNQMEIYFSIVQRKVLSPMTLPIATPWPSASSIFNTIGKLPPVPSHGGSPVTILLDSLQSSAVEIDKNTLVNF